MRSATVILAVTLVVIGASADSIIPGRKHNILTDSSNNGAFDLFFRTVNGGKVGCRGSVVNAKEILQEIYYEDAAGLQRNGKAKNAQLRLLVVPSLSRNSDSKTSVEILGLANFALWPRECILDLINLKAEHLLAQESVEDVATGVVSKKTYAVTSEPNGWWLRYPESEATDALVSKSGKGAGGQSCSRVSAENAAADPQRVDGGCGGGCDACSACSKCSGWGPIIGGNATEAICDWIDLTLTTAAAAAPAAKQSEAAVVPAASAPVASAPASSFGALGSGRDGPPTNSQTASINAGGGGGYGDGDDGTIGGHGGNVEGSVLAGVGNNGNAGIYMCNDDNFALNGVIITGNTNTLGTSNTRAGRAKKLI